MNEVFPLDRAAEAYEHMMSGKARFRVVLERYAVLQSQTPARAPAGAHLCRRQLILVALVVLALRLPFLNQAFQGDDILYLTEAAHAQIEPLHPKHTTYVFMGRDIDMRGQSHPPLNAWFLALLIAAGKGVSEIPFHAAYILFSLIAAFSALALARRFSPHPLLATLLFCATPAFVINGTSLEADLPFVALWLLSTALYIFAVDRKSCRF